MRFFAAIIAICIGLLSLPRLLQAVDDLGCWWVRRCRHARLDRLAARRWHNTVANAIRNGGLSALPPHQALELQAALRSVLRAEKAS